MALTPQSMMMLRRGPTAGPSPVPGGAPPGGGVPGAGMPANPAADPGSMLMSAIADRMNQAKKVNSNFGVANLEQQQRVVGVMQLHYMQSHPEVARHLNRAWASLDAAKKALNDAVKEQALSTGPPLGFSGAGIGPTQAGPPGSGGGGPMGTPS